MTTVDDMTPQAPRRAPARRRDFAALAGLAGLVVLGGCAKDAPQDTWQPAGDNAQKIDDLQRFPFAIAGVILVLVIAAVGYCVFRFRDRGQAIPAQTHGKPALEITLTVIPALILVAVAIPTTNVLFELAETSDTECVINVTGQQWWWEYDYPVQEGCGGISEPIVTSGQLVMPTETNVLLRITSRDVIHSYWIPKLNGKRDAVPGRIHTLRLEADQPGIYAGQCTEFCGLSHANMRMEAVALNDGDFATWKANQLEAYTVPEEGSLAAEGEGVFVAQCARCHQVDGLTGSDGEPIIANPVDFVWAGAAPNLTNLMTRNTFAGSSWDLLTKQCRADVWTASPEDFGALYLAGVSEDCLNQVDLREWLRNAPAKKPMFTESAELDETDGKTRGMPYLGLSESDIDKLIAYLLERK